MHLAYPFAGSRMLRDLLRGEGIAIGRELVATMMRRMCIEALYRRPNTSKPADGNKIYPYLLRGRAVERPNQVWAMDITYIPMARGFVYLAAVVDWFSRRVLTWRLSITMEVEFCLDAVEEALARYGRTGDLQYRPGQPFTSAAFTGLLLENAIAISMEWPRFVAQTNVFVERLWRTIEMGRVGMWRGGVRSGISVAAPFVWRCLNGLTIAPFPHPPHRTWRANFPHHALGKTSPFRPRHVVPKPGQAYQPKCP